ncbi:MAG: hypothetical protein LUB83_05920, partial [Prevotellaceae bacterium]|nr:hypothetical protein [Prevotellaceae bacterium]
TPKHAGHNRQTAVRIALFIRFINLIPLQRYGLFSYLLLGHGSFFCIDSVHAADGQRAFTNCILYDNKEADTVRSMIIIYLYNKWL